MFKKSLFLFVLIIASSFALYLPSSDASYEAYDFENYDVKIVVDENYTFHITEKLNVYFYEERHGIYRSLNNYWGDDRIKYTNIEVDGAPMKIEKGRNYTDIRIGDANTTITGFIEYEISYTISLPKDSNNEIDAVYMNVLGYENDTTIHNAHITIELPKRVDPSFLSVVTGYYYDSGIENKVSYEYVDRQTLDIRLLEQLDAYEGMTVKIDLPQGYFQNVKQPFFLDEAIKIFMPLALLLLSILLWAIFGNDRRVIMPVEFSLDDISPVEAGYIIDGKVDEEDVSSMLIYWASLGFIRIEKCKGEGNYKFLRIKGISRRPKYERKIFKSIFKKADKGNINTATMKTRLGMNIGTFKRDVLAKYNNKLNKLLDGKSQNCADFIGFFAYVCFAMLGFFMGYQQQVGLGVFYAIGFLFAFIPIRLWLKRLLSYARKRTVLENIKKFFPFVLLVGAYGYVIDLLRHDFMYSLSQLAIMMGSAILLVIISFYTQRLSAYGHSIYERVLGFRHFLITAEKSWLDTLAEDDPEFFYSRLPYALVLGVSRAWIGKFAASVSAPPTWYEGTSKSFNSRTFSSTMASDFSRIGEQAQKEAYGFATSSSTSSYRPSTYSSSSSFSSGSSSSFSGGGFSGGGSSSW